jgi:hypothetical protein
MYATSFLTCICHLHHEIMLHLSLQIWSFISTKKKHMPLQDQCVFPLTREKRHVEYFQQHKSSNNVTIHFL